MHSINVHNILNVDMSRDEFTDDLQMIQTETGIVLLLEYNSESQTVQIHKVHNDSFECDLSIVEKIIHNLYKKDSKSITWETITSDDLFDSAIWCAIKCANIVHNCQTPIKDIKQNRNIKEWFNDVLTNQRLIPFQ